jgi:hypothetical protein
MDIYTLECGTKQIVLHPTDSYEILFQDESGNDMLTAFSGNREHILTAVTYENGIRTEQQRYSFKTSAG